MGRDQILISVIANGSGPTVILEGGNHGDEYEGPIAITELMQELDPARVQGRLIALPALNTPAVEAGCRVSPLDGLNMNRTFPGDPIGSITQQISAFVSDTLLSIGDAFLDLHSGGSSLWITPSAIIEPSGDPALDARNGAAVEAFGAPMTVVLDNMGDSRTAMATAAVPARGRRHGNGRRGRGVAREHGDLPARLAQRTRAPGRPPPSDAQPQPPPRAMPCLGPAPMPLPTSMACSSRCTATAMQCTAASLPAASGPPGRRTGRR